MLTLRDATGSPSVRFEGRKEFVQAPLVDAPPIMLVGPTERGPAFVPFEVNTWEELDVRFGMGETYTTYAAREALRETDRVTIIRIMNEEGWTPRPIALYVGANELDLDEDGYLTFPIYAPYGYQSENVLLLSVLTFEHEFEKRVDFDRITIDDDATVDAFRLTLYENGSDNVLRSYRLSFNNASKFYIESVLENEPVNLYINYPETQQRIYDVSPNAVLGMTREFMEAPLSFEEHPYTYAMSPWVVSQKLESIHLDEQKPKPLFRFVARGAGYSENRRFKIGIRDIGESMPGSEYPFFTVQIRAIDDTDFDPQVLEEYRRVTLDPSHDRYIGRMVGDRYTRFRNGRLESYGRFPNVSRYVRIEFHPNIDLVEPEAVPFGFTPYYPPMAGDLLNAGRVVRPLGGLPEKSFGPEYRMIQSVGTITNYTNVTRPEVGRALQEKIHYGLDFTKKENLNYLNPVADPYFTCFYADPNQVWDEESALERVRLIDGQESSTQIYGCQDLMDDYRADPFNLEDCIDHYDANGNVVHVSTSSDLAKKKFVFGMQGGFDGTDPYKERHLGQKINEANFYGFDLSTPYSSGMKTYRKALQIIQNVEGGFEYDLLLTPGIMKKYHSQLIFEIDEMVRERGDVFYVFDLVNREDRVDEAIRYASDFETNYGATYFGWLDVRNFDPHHEYVPASCVIPRIYARNDRNAAPWFAPAGFTRGLVDQVQDVRYRLTEGQMDLLYDECINPINYFERDGICIWGQKTLYKSESLLDRINVRRLMVTVKSVVRRIARSFLFEQNLPENRAALQRSIVNYLNTVLTEEGLYDFNVTIQEDSNLGATIDPHAIVGKIELRPVVVNEYLLINFTVLQEGDVLFSD